MLKDKAYTLKIIITGVLAAAITLLHYVTSQSRQYDHIVLRELYFLPILLGAFWFGLRGGLFTSLIVSMLYLPHVIIHWQGFSPEDLSKILEVVFFNVIAVVLGMLRDREKKREHEKREAILALTGTVAHELNSPLQVVLGSAQLLQDDFNPESEAYSELQVIISNIKTIRQLIQKIASLDRFSTKQYTGDTKIVDIS